MKRKNKWIAAFAGCTVAAAAYFYWQNNDIDVSTYSYASHKVPPKFHNFNIVHVSDLHNKAFGLHNKTLLHQIRRANPDVILISGDLVDRHYRSFEHSLAFCRQALDIAPVYFAPGNHEARSGTYEDFRGKLQSLGVRVLENEKEVLYRDGAVLELLGICDPSFSHLDFDKAVDVSVTLGNLRAITESEDHNLRLLISHRPELIKVYAKFGIELVFTGHAHGGQWRIPGVGGLYTPHEGFFPKYSGGMHRLNATTMFISRGLGNSGFPLRIFNRPELIVVTLKSK